MNDPPKTTLPRVASRCARIAEREGGHLDANDRLHGIGAIDDRPATEGDRQKADCTGWEATTHCQGAGTMGE